MRSGVAAEQAHRPPVVLARRVGGPITRGPNATGAVVTGQWPEPVADVELAGFLAALERVVGAAEVLLQQGGADTEHPRGNRQPLGFGAVEQFVGRPVERGTELPAEVIAALPARVQALAAGRRMHVRGVS